jgi:hypothetical protein
VLLATLEQRAALQTGRFEPSYFTSVLRLEALAQGRRDARINLNEAGGCLLLDLLGVYDNSKG